MSAGSAPSGAPPIYDPPITQPEQLWAWLHDADTHPPAPADPPAAQEAHNG